MSTRREFLKVLGLLPFAKFVKFNDKPAEENKYQISYPGILTADIIAIDDQHREISFTVAINEKTEKAYNMIRNAFDNQTTLTFNKEIGGSNLYFKNMRITSLIVSEANPI